MALKPRIKKLEESLCSDASKDAVFFARFLVGTGEIPPEREDEEVQRLIREGFTLAKLMKQIDGATRGLPKRIPEESE